MVCSRIPLTRDRGPVLNRDRDNVDARMTKLNRKPVKSV